MYGRIDHRAFCFKLLSVGLIFKGRICERGKSLYQQLEIGFCPVTKYPRLTGTIVRNCLRCFLSRYGEKQSNCCCYCFNIFVTFSFFERLKTFAVCFARMPMRSSWELLMKHPIGVAGLLNLDSIFKQSAIEYTYLSFA